MTDANFTEATLKSTDFRKANLTLAYWFNAQKLDRVRYGTTYLKNALLRQVLVTGLGEKQIFDQQSLRGVNLQKANLKDASFIAADLSESNLQDADLSRAKLVQTQLDKTDLTGATLTGAYIEEWNISTDTKLHGIKCDYIFMRLPPEKRPNFLALPPEEKLDENPRRKPDDWNKDFEDGEFADFIAPLVQTLDLYHNKVVDPRFIAIAFQELKEAHPEADLEIISIEKKGKNRDKTHIKAETSPQADVSTLHADYFSNLEYLQSLPPEAQQVLLAERAEMIKLLAGLLGSSSKANPEISIVTNNSLNQENEPRNINIDEGNYNEDIKRNYIQGDASNE
ncbi:pentapeptide repeat-containing protein [Aetokthonos hydrillicola]|uniref:pentapeptide repeat-containing protein n=1 Tax=Aetokthonos hydrillicola TaxID=1550245 RepID=UPI001ABB823C